MESKVITLPSQEEMLKRLIAVNDTDHLQEKFYPLLLKHAGEEKVAMGVVLMLQLAIHDYTQGLPAVMVMLLNINMDGFIEALIEDKEVADEAKAFFQKVQDTANAKS